MPTFSVLFAVATLLWSFAQAPFLHVHVADHDHDHNSGAVHMHFRSTALGPGARLLPETDDDDAIDLVWSVSAPQAFHLHLDLELLDQVAVEPPLLTHANIAPSGLHSHDPPLLSSRYLRGPPA